MTVALERPVQKTGIEPIKGFPINDSLRVHALSLAERADYSQVTEYFAATSDNYISTQFSDQRNDGSRPTKYEPGERWRTPVTHQALGATAAAYAEASVVMGLLCDRPSVVAAAPYHFGTAHYNLAAAEDYAGCERNARRAAEAAALMGDGAAFAEWTYLSGTDDPELRAFVWNHYEDTRVSWQEYVAHEARVEATPGPEAWASLIGSTVATVVEFANRANQIPPQVAESSDPHRLGFLQARHRHLEALRKGRTPGVDPWVPLTVTHQNSQGLDVGRVRKEVVSRKVGDLVVLTKSGKVTHMRRRIAGQIDNLRR